MPVAARLACEGFVRKHWSGWPRLEEVKFRGRLSFDLDRQSLATVGVCGVWGSRHCRRCLVWGVCDVVGVVPLFLGYVLLVVVFVYYFRAWLNGEF